MSGVVSPRAKGSPVTLGREIERQMLLSSTRQGWSRQRHHRSSAAMWISLVLTSRWGDRDSRWTDLMARQGRARAQGATRRRDLGGGPQVRTLEVTTSQLARPGRYKLRATHAGTDSTNGGGRVLDSEATSGHSLREGQLARPVGTNYQPDGGRCGRRLGGLATESEPNLHPESASTQDNNYSPELEPQRAAFRRDVPARSLLGSQQDRS
jgi:hypothetical protein